jgi:hypothetical protein
MNVIIYAIVVIAVAGTLILLLNTFVTRDLARMQRGRGASREKAAERGRVLARNRAVEEIIPGNRRLTLDTDDFRDLDAALAAALALCDGEWPRRIEVRHVIEMPMRRIEVRLADQTFVEEEHMGAVPSSQWGTSELELFVRAVNRALAAGGADGRLLDLWTGEFELVAFVTANQHARLRRAGIRTSRVRFS